jgi:hypothetical protein
MISTTPSNVSARPLDRAAPSKAARAVAAERPAVPGRPDGDGPRLPQDRVTISPEALRDPRAGEPREPGSEAVEPAVPRGPSDARELSRAPPARETGEGLRSRRVEEEAEPREAQEGRAAGEASDAKEPGGAERNDAASSPSRPELTPEQKAAVAELQARDAEVRAHEAAHQGAGGGLTGGASFTYETGPDGRAYAVGGEVPISIQPGRTPEETIRNAQRVRAAALAPAEPSAADLSVAASASQMESEARMELVRKAAETYRATAGEKGGRRASAFDLAA